MKVLQILIITKDLYNNIYNLSKVCYFLNRLYIDIYITKYSALHINISSAKGIENDI